jgi:hypothetical protein
MVLLQNRLIDDEQAKVMMNDLEACERMFSTESRHNTTILDNMGIFLEFCFKRQKRENFINGLCNLVHQYTTDQINILLSMTTNCLQIHLNSSDTAVGDTHPFIIRVCNEFLMDAVDSLSSDMLPHVGSRLTSVVDAIRHIVQGTGVDVRAGATRSAVSDWHDTDENEAVGAHEAEDNTPGKGKQKKKKGDAREVKLSGTSEELTANC